MSRSGYSDDGCGWSTICWRGAVASASRGYRGQAFFKALLAALDELPVKRLIADNLVQDGEFCLLGVLGSQRGIDIEQIDPEDSDTVANQFNIAPALAKEVVWINDEAGHYNETPEDRFIRARAWVAAQILEEDTK